MQTSLQSVPATLQVDLHDLSLRDAFIVVVLNAPEVVALESELAGRLPMFSRCMQTGQLPSWRVDYQWPLHSSADTLANGFVYLPISFLGDPRPTPSEDQIRAGASLAARFSVLVRLLACGEMIAVGTFWKNGCEQEISARTWESTNLTIDVRNSDVYRVGTEEPIWTGVWLRRRGDHFATPSALPEEEARSDQVVCLMSAENASAEWLYTLMADTTIAPMSKAELRRQAEQRWGSDLSDRGFERSRERALDRLIGTPRWSIWKRPGRKPKSPLSNHHTS